jgi:hypothetical protein
MANITRVPPPKMDPGTSPLASTARQHPQVKPASSEEWSRARGIPGEINSGARSPRFGDQVRPAPFGAVKVPVNPNPGSKANSGAK